MNEIKGMRSSSPDREGAHMRWKEGGERIGSRGEEAVATAEWGIGLAGERYISSILWGWGAVFAETGKGCSAGESAVKRFPRKSHGCYAWPNA